MVNRVRFRIEGENRADTAIRSLNASLGQMKSALAGIAGVVSVRMLANFVKDTLDATEHIGNLADRLNTSTEAMSEFQHVAKMTDVEFEALTKSMQRMAVFIGNATKEASDGAKTLKDMGLSARTLAGMSLDKQFEVIADGLVGIKNESQRAAAAQKIFGKGGVELLQVLNRGSAGIRELREEARAFGLSLSRDTVDAAGEAADAIDRLDQAILGLKRSLALEFAPALSTVFTSIAEFVANPFAEQMAANLERAKGELRELGDILQAQISERDNVDFLERFFGMDEDEWNRRIDATLARMRELGKEIELLEMGKARDFQVGLGTDPAVTDQTAEQAADDLVTKMRKFVEQKHMPVKIFPDIQLETLADPNSLQMQMQKWVETHHMPVKIFPEVELLDIEEEVGKMDKTFANFRDSLATGLSSSLADAFMGIEQDWGDMLKRMAAQVAADALINAIFGSISGAAGGAGGGLLSKLFSGATAKASGGSFSAGQKMLVGELGPELVRFGKGGRVEPAGSWSTGAPKVTIINQVPGAQVSAREERSNDGVAELYVMVQQLVDGNIANGRHDRTLRGRFGVTPLPGGRR